MATEDKIIKDAQYRKGLSIAFFNATNAAIALVSSHHFDKQEDHKGLVLRVCEIRDLFLDEHKKYYGEVIAQVGLPYNSTETIEKLKKAETKEELRLMWLALSADEKHDGDVLKVAKELKKTLK